MNRASETTATEPTYVYEESKNKRRTRNRQKDYVKMTKTFQILFKNLIYTYKKPNEIHTGYTQRGPH